VYVLKNGKIKNGKYGLSIVVDDKISQIEKIVDRGDIP